MNRAKASTSSSTATNAATCGTHPCSSEIPWWKPGYPVRAAGARGAGGGPSGGDCTPKGSDGIGSRGENTTAIVAAVPRETL
ncbi:hypothetical protein GCM10010198_25270 [Nocardia seriolae]|nr:hypothetical protein NSER024013_02840 [Nocardia seriolae]